MIKIRKQSALQNFPKASIKVSIKITATVWTDIKIHLHCWYQASRKQPSRAKNETCENVETCHNLSLKLSSMTGARERDNSSIHQLFNQFQTLRTQKKKKQPGMINMRKSTDLEWTASKQANKQNYPVIDDKRWKENKQSKWN